MSDKTTMTDTNVSAIDAAIAAAKARKAAKASGETGAPKALKAPKEPKPAKEPKPKATDEEKAAKLAEREAARAAAKALRDAARAEKLAEKLAAREPAHLKKVAKAAAKLGALSEQAQLTFNEITANFPAPMIATLAAHLAHFNRVSATVRAANVKVEAGQTVEITGGDPRFIGRVGTVAKAQRIRCYVTLEGLSKPVYLFTSDVTQVAEAVEVATGTEG